MAGVSSWHDILKEKCFFCKKMLNLKEFILDGGGAFADTTFLTRLHEAFPGLETFSMNGGRYETFRFGEKILQL